MLTCVFLFGLVARGSGAPPARPAPSEAARLIEQLSDDDYRKRVEAAGQLRKMGEKALPDLRKALGHADAEVRKQVQELIPAIETESFVTPRRITLHARNKSLRTIFDDIAKQSGYKIEFWAKNSKATYSFDFKDVTFWEAIDRISHDANLGVQQQYNDRVPRVVLQEQQGHLDYVTHWGAFRFVPHNLSHTRNIQLGPVNAGPQVMPYQRNESLSVGFTVFSEPRLAILGMGEVRLEAAYDEEKNSMLMPANNPGYYPGMWNPGWRISRYGNGNRSNFLQTQINLQRPSEKASRIKEVRGVVPVTLLVEEKPVPITSKFMSSKGTKMTVGTTTFDIMDVSQPNKNQKQYQMQISITEDNKDNPNDYGWMNSIYNRIELQDDNGNKYQNYGINWMNSGPNNVQLTMTFGHPGAGNVKAPTKLVFMHWKTIQYNVRFTLKDLPLP
jgi:hypothetical protein